jgi:hypothetical protein
MRSRVSTFEPFFAKGSLHTKLLHRSFIGNYRVGFKHFTRITPYDLGKRKRMIIEAKSLDFPRFLAFF